MSRTIIRSLLLPGTMAFAVSLAGCSGADNPKLAEVPQIKIPEKVEPPVIPGRKDYGSNPKYQEIMERQARQQQGQR